MNLLGIGVGFEPLVGRKRLRSNGAFAKQALAMVLWYFKETTNRFLFKITVFRVEK
jgi:hypothetical protein